MLPFSMDNKLKKAGGFGFSWQTNVPENPLPPGMPHQDAGKVCCQQRENVTRAPRVLPQWEL